MQANPTLHFINYETGHSVFLIVVAHPAIVLTANPLQLNDDVHFNSCCMALM